MFSRMSSRRMPGPTRRGLSIERAGGRLGKRFTSVVMGPRFRGDDSMDCALLSRGRARAPDIAGRLPKALEHDGGQILFPMRHAGAGPHRIALRVSGMRRAVA